MTTKAGLLRKSDFHHGLVGWAVRVEPNSAGGFDIEPPAKILVRGRPFPWTSFSVDDDKVTSYKTFVVDFEYADKTNKHYSPTSWGSFSFAEFDIPGGNYDPDRVYYSRVFRKEKQALKFIANFSGNASRAEIEEARLVDNFMACVKNLPQPVYDPLPPEPSVEELLYVRDHRRYLRVPGTKLQKRIGSGMSTAYNLMTTRQDTFGETFFPTVTINAEPVVVEPAVPRYVPEGIKGRKRSKKETRHARKFDVRYQRGEDVFEYKAYREDHCGPFDIKNFRLESGKKGAKRTMR